MAALPPPFHLLHFLRSQPTISPSTSFVSHLKPVLVFSVSSPSALSKGVRQIPIPPLPKTLFLSYRSFPTPASTFFHFLSSSSIDFSQRPSAAGVGTEEVENDGSFDYAVEQDGEETTLINDELERISVEGAPIGYVDSSSSPLVRNREEKLKLPSLTVKERKELASYAQSLGKKLKSQLVGKSGVTSNVATSFIETLEANELLKIKIHRSCPGDLDDVVKQLEDATGSVAVSQIGRTVIIYRPSLTKLKAEEKKQQARKIFLRRQQKSKLSKRQAPKLSRPALSRS